MMTCCMKGRNLRDYFQTKGYFDVQVTYSQAQSADGQRREVVYKIDRGQRHKFVDLVIAGTSIQPGRNSRAHGHAARWRIVAVWAFQPVNSRARHPGHPEPLYE